MSTKKNKSRNKGSEKKSLFRENVEDRELPRKGKERNGKKKKSAQLKQTSLNSFTILKQAGEALQDDISEESFNPPLHSTAVYTEDEDLLEKSKVSSEKSASRASSGPNVSQDKSGRKNSAQKNKSAASEHHSLTPKSVPGKKQKKTYEKTRPKAKRKKTPKKKEPNKAKQKENIQLRLWSPEDAPGTAKDVNELDVILFESESLVNHYRESIDGASEKAVDMFFLSYKDQLTTAIKNVRMLKGLKRKNAKMRLEIRRKQKRLIEVNDEIMKKQPRLHQLQRDCSELEERQESIKNSRTFLDNLGQLKEDYRTCKAKKPCTKETYGLSSLPALILQAQSTMKAKQHFHNVNTQLLNAQTQGK
ncbi:unnamed protein product [Staurois parvus]|uniref:Centromere protein U n=1 Tax=Staurois parvus TaxID=386267 RepID=A0ABN9BUK0_9NEOB|nr:unnamed protein product [Staurois parvus]